MSLLEIERILHKFTKKISNCQSRKTVFLVVQRLVFIDKVGNGIPTLSYKYGYSILGCDVTFPQMLDKVNIVVSLSTSYMYIGTLYMDKEIIRIKTYTADKPS
jgi:hypothetical protein